jgi:hypothetical protein
MMARCEAGNMVPSLAKPRASLWPKLTCTLQPESDPAKLI